MDIMEKVPSKKRLIDANKLLKNGIRVSYGFDNDGVLLIPMSDVIRSIKNAPTVDAVEVVRCRECNQGEVDDPDFPDQYYCHAGCGWNKGDFYCAYGELKEGAE